MMSLKKLFNRVKPQTGVVKYSSQRSLREAPPPGQVTDRYDPHTHIWKPQFSCGDQSDESRVAFYNSGFSACIKCGKRNVWRFEEKAGIRPNGEVYGTDIFRCQTKGCKWKTSLKYDDGVPYCIHFEARGWPKGIHFYPVKFMLLWCDRHGLKQLKRQLYSRKIDGDAFLALYHSGMMQEALQLNSKTISAVKKALHQPNGSLLSKNLCKKSR